MRVEGPALILSVISGLWALLCVAFAAIDLACLVSVFRGWRSVSEARVHKYEAPQNRTQPSRQRPCEGCICKEDSRTRDLFSRFQLRFM